MAKQGFSYYKAETDRFQDIKIKRLKKKHHCTGYAVYQYLLNEIYRVRGYMLCFTEDHLFDVSEYWDLEESVVTEVIGYCAEIGLFDARLWQEKGVLTARSIQSRYLDICKICKKTPSIDEELRLVDAEQVTPPEPLPQLFPPEVLPSMRIIQKETPPAAATAAVSAPAPGKAVEGTGRQVIARLRSEEKTVVREDNSVVRKEKAVIPEDFRKLPETSRNFSEEPDKSINSYANKTTSSNSPTKEEAEKASPKGNGERLRLLLTSMSIVSEDARWINTIEGIDADDSPLWALAEEVRQSKGRLTVCSYLLPSLRSLVAAGRLKVRHQAVDTAEELRLLLRQIRVPSYDIERVLAVAQGQERVLREAIEEVRRSKGKITMPARYLLSQLRKAAPAKAS